MGGWDANWFYCQVPMKQTTDVRGKRTYPLRCTMILLNYSTNVIFECGPSPADVNVAACTEAASIIRGRHVVEGFLAYGLWPLSEDCPCGNPCAIACFSKFVLEPPVIARIVRWVEKASLCC
jgi:hypothetical protein